MRSPKAQGKRAPVYMPGLEKPSSKMVNALAGRAGKIGGLATLLKVFLPYLVWNTVFDNSRVVAEMGRAPAPFSNTVFPLLQFSRENHFTYQISRMAGSTGAEHCAGQRTGAGFHADDGLRPGGLGQRPHRDEQDEWMFGAGDDLEAGQKLKLLFAGYNGTRNTGADVRVEEMLRQVRRILGEQNISLSVMTHNFDLTRGYFGDASRCIFRCYFRRSFPKCRNNMAWWRRRLDVQKQICERARLP